jgi:superfamily II RNA helicase
VTLDVLCACLPLAAPKSDHQSPLLLARSLTRRQVIVFSFSKRECETRAAEMQALDLTDTEEKKLIESIYSNAMECLSVEDQRLPQITALLPMLKRGIGVHHAGLLPIVKEAVEILFGEGLLRALFATGACCDVRCDDVVRGKER